MPKRKARTQRVMCPETYVDVLEEEFVQAIAEGLKTKGVPKRLAEVSRPRPRLMHGRRHCGRYRHLLEHPRTCCRSSGRVPQSTKLKLLEMRTSVFEAIRERVEPVEDPAAGETEARGALCPVRCSCRDAGRAASAASDCLTPAPHPPPPCRPADAVPQPLDRGVLARISDAERRVEAASGAAKRLRREVPAELAEAAERVSAAAEKALTGTVEADEEEEDDDDDAAAAAASSGKAAAAAALAAGALLRAAAQSVTGEAGRVEAAAQAVTMEARIGTTDADRAAAGKGAKGRSRR